VAPVIGNDERIGVPHGERPARPRSRIKQRRQRRSLATLAALMLFIGTCIATRVDDGRSRREAKTDGTAGPDADPTPTATRPSFDGWVDPASFGRPYSETVDGILTFRGNPTRSFYGTGPMPKRPEVLWAFPDEPMCGESAVGGQAKTWCGSGWTGQPSVWQREGRTWVAFGAYDKAVHVLDGATGERILDDFATGDIIKGSVTVDPDGYPLLYTGSRDGYFHVVALDRERGPEELWKLSSKAVSPTKWNDDWDGSALVVDDFLFEGGENSQFHVVDLDRGYDAAGKVTVAPKLVFNTPGWDDQLLRDLGGDDEVSIESSVAISGDTVYFANSGGLVQGWDLAPLRGGGDPIRTFRFWTGDDTDASIVVDDDGMLYVGSEYERDTERSREVGQLMKLDPTKPDDPLVWSVADRDTDPAGIWATPALADGMVYAATNGGRLLGVDAMTGEVRWTKKLDGPTWQSPVVVDGVLVEGDCDGVLHGFDVSDPGIEPEEIWTVELGGCIESTPAVWRGRIYVGTRGGRFFAIGDA
jgi:outer membrane protein assembly factor BamB